MLRFVIRRLLSAIPMIIAVMTACFFIIRMAPGSPFDRDSVELSAEVKANLRAQYGFDKPLYEQYLIFMKNGLQGEFGESYSYRGQSVSEIIREALPVSATIGFLSLTVSLLIGVTLGAICAVRQNSIIDYFTVGFAALGRSIPPMVLAPILVEFLAVRLGWLPAAGWGNGALNYLIGPVLCLALYDITTIARLSRGSLLEILRSKHLITARAKGLPETSVIIIHALREAMLPVVTYLGPAAAGILVGTVVIEQVFNIPGLGRYWVSAAVNRDYTLLLGILTLNAVLLTIMNTLSDIAVGLLDPRIRMR